MNNLYHTKKVCFKNNNANIILSGTLTIPKTSKKPPAVILISGMGPNDRDYTMQNHKLFLVLATHLAKNGIASLRYDKRGVGKSTGTFDLTVTSKDLAGDVQAAVKYLQTQPEIDQKQIGLIGHSEGAIIAPMVITQSKNIAFAVLMAGAATTTPESIVNQVAMQLRADGASEKLIAKDSEIRKQMFKIITTESNLEIAEKQLQKAATQYINNTPPKEKAESTQFLFAINEKNKDHMITLFNSPWYRHFFQHDPNRLLTQIKIPILAINGDKDFITTSKVSLPLIEKALQQAENKHYKIVEFPNQNHWFQTCKTGAMNEYGNSKHTIEPSVLSLISSWILKP